MTLCWLTILRFISLFSMNEKSKKYHISFPNIKINNCQNNAKLVCKIAIKSLNLGKKRVFISTEREIVLKNNWNIIPIKSSILECHDYAKMLFNSLSRREIKLRPRTFNSRRDYVMQGHEEKIIVSENYAKCVRTSRWAKM